MGKKAGIGALLAATALFGFAADAGKPDKQPQGRPEVLEKVIGCRSIAASEQRLACYDAQVSALDEAAKKNDLVVMDRQQVKETRKSLFGFPLPTLGIFGGGDKEDKKLEADDVKEIDSTVASARQLGNYNWSVTLDKDGGTWETLQALDFPPRAGQKIHIAKAAFGSYLGSVGTNRGIRFRRVG